MGVLGHGQFGHRVNDCLKCVTPRCQTTLILLYSADFEGKSKVMMKVPLRWRCRTMRRLLIVVLSILPLFGSSTSAADWLTDGGDVMRNNWQKDEKIINTKNAKDIKLLWKIKLDNEPRQMHSLLPPLVIGSLNTSSGPKQLVIQAGVSDNLYAIDVGTGELLWKKHFDSTFKEP